MYISTRLCRISHKEARGVLRPTSSGLAILDRLGTPTDPHGRAGRLLLPPHNPILGAWFNSCAQEEIPDLSGAAADATSPRPPRGPAATQEQAQAGKQTAGTATGGKFKGPA